MLAKLRALSSETLIYGVSTVMGRLLTFLLTPLYTNYVSPAELGDTAYLYTLIAFVNVVYSCGFDSAFFKFFHTSSENKTNQNPHEYNRSVFVHSLFGIVLIAGAVTVLLLLFSSNVASILRLSVVEVGGMLVMYSALIAFFDALTLIPYAALRMEQRAKRFAMTKFAVILLNVSANIVCVVWLQMGIRGIFLAGLLSAFAGVLLLVPEFVRYLLRSGIRLDGALFGELWRFGLPTVPAAFSAMMLQVIDRPIIKFFLGSSVLGIYQANYRLGIPMMMMVTVFEYAWKPFYLREYAAASKRTIKQRRAFHVLLAQVLTYFTAACCCVFLLSSLCMEYVVRLPFVGGRFVNPVYWSGLGLVPIVLGAYYFNGMFTHFAASVYIRKRTKYLPLISGISALSNIALNIALIPVLGIQGAAWATLGAYMVSAAGMFALTRRIYPVRYQWKSLAGLIVSALAIFFLAQSSTETLSLETSFFVRCAWIAAYPLVVLALGIVPSISRPTKR
ncbi:MAG: hypothetical protein EAZ92_14250 [Candidatus Kapaibacterium sp.]|nr:MAG: hypothetical protein EAZ92_14250 [Candidatus Kapabacteria bacterium]